MDWNQNVSRKQLEAISQRKWFLIQRKLQTDKGDVKGDLFQLKMLLNLDGEINRSSYVAVGGMQVCCLYTQNNCGM